VAIRHDITQLKLAEEQIRQQTIELQRAAHLSFTGELAAGLAHEIKNPLAGIQGAVDILIRRRDANDPEREALEGVRHQVQRIDNTVRALLDRARPRNLKLMRASVTELMQATVDLARAQRGGRGGDQVQIEFVPSAEDIFLVIDAAQIEDAVLNLMINAMAAVDEGGKVTVRIYRVQPKDDEAADEAVIEVSDNGRGIDPQDLANIFSPFFTTSKGGTGLGLPAVRRIARVHGGSVDVKSVVGEGSTFIIRLPITE
jgi:signal transduction histidine kinase